jgi:hypothetical protein
MTFDIKREMDTFDDEEALLEYQEELVNLFANSPEGQAREKVDDDMKCHD